MSLRISILHSDHGFVLSNFLISPCQSNSPIFWSLNWKDPEKCANCPSGVRWSQCIKGQPENLRVDQMDVWELPVKAHKCFQITDPKNDDSHTHTQWTKFIYFSIIHDGSCLTWIIYQTSKRNLSVHNLTKYPYPSWILQILFFVSACFNNIFLNLSFFYNGSVNKDC